MTFRRRIQALEQQAADAAELQLSGVLIQQRDGTLRQSNGRPFDPEKGGWLIVPEPCESIEEWEALP